MVLLVSTVRNVMLTELAQRTWMVDPVKMPGKVRRWDSPMAAPTGGGAWFLLGVAGRRRIQETDGPATGEKGKPKKVGIEFYYVEKKEILLVGE